jgi:hypothetical protein
MIQTAVAWCRVPGALAAFLLRGPSLKTLETIEPTPQWVRHYTLIQMVAYRNVLLGWEYRAEFARLVRRVRRRLPDWLTDRLLLRPFCAVQLAAMTRRNVARYGARVKAETGLPLAYQLADVYRVCLEHPGTFPTEYYVFSLHDPRQRQLSDEITNAYQIEMVASIVQPAKEGTFFVSANLEVLNDKERFRELCALADVPVAPTVATFDAGAETWHGASELPKADLFLKPLRGGEGRGAARVFYDSATDTYRVDNPATHLGGTKYPTEALSADALVAWLRQAANELPFILQPRLKACSELVELVGDRTLPTARILTVCDRAGVSSLVYAYLRFAIGDVPVDNVSAGGAASMIDLRTSQLGPASTRFAGSVDVHPMTGRRLLGFKVPQFDLACSYAVRLHQALAASQEIPVPLLGWDLAFTEGTPLVIEGNSLSAISTPQMLVGRGAWADEPFASSILSYLVPLRGRKHPLDPALVPRH